MLQLTLCVSILDIFPATAWSLDKAEVPKSPSAQVLDEDSLLQKQQYQQLIDRLSPKISDLDNRKLKILGRAYSGIKNSISAIKTFNLAVTKDPKDAEASTLVGSELLSQGKDREAMLSFRDAIKADPKYENAYFGIEKIYVKKGNKYELRMLYSDMIDLMGEKPHYMSRLCELYTTGGLYEEAKKICQRGIQLKKDDPKNYVFLATTLKETGDREGAIKLYKKTAEDFKNSEEAQLALALFSESEKNYPDAAKYFKAASVANPASLKSLTGFAMMSLELQNFQDTYDSLEKSCKMDRRTVKEVKHAAAILRTMKQEAWYEKLMVLAEKCGIQ